MTCMPETRLQRLDVLIQDYEYWSGRVSEVYGKDFDFFKQHALNHVVRDIRDKGTTNHASSRPGEGFQQEARNAYARTNGKNAAHQAIARIRMNIDKYDEARHKSQDSDDAVDETPVDPQTGAHWAFGAPVPGRIINSRVLEEVNAGSALFRDFDFRLRMFISDEFPEEYIKFEDTILSMEDWHGARDIMQCNPSFHQRARYDCVLVNVDKPGLHFARVHSLLRCKLPSGRQIDIALVRMFEPSRWKPRT
ncbi:hypothetical protein B0H19DRAFT_1082599 [Mycena capillaripes]|nr:hypothetical protein B0H19DRAFT_1082599 [Mycena capillaripes]